MAATGNRGGGRRSKGDRKLVGARVPVSTAEQLARLSDIKGCAVSDILTDYINKGLQEDRQAFDEYEQQQQHQQQLFIAARAS